MSELTIEEQQQQYVTLWGSRITPPLRPNVEQIAFYEKCFREVQASGPSRHIILGSTVELRDVVLRCGEKPLCCDMSPDIWNAFKDIMKERGDELFMEGNWLELPVDTQYDLVLSDGSIVMLSPDQIEPFIDRIAAITKRDGLAVLRVGVRDGSRALDALRTAMTSYRQEDHGLSVYMYTALLIGALRCEHHVDMRIRAFSERYLYPHCTQTEIEEFSGDLIDWDTYYIEKSDLENMFERYFGVEEVLKGEGPGYWDSEYTYALRRR